MREAPGLTLVADDDAQINACGDGAGALHVDAVRSARDERPRTGLDATIPDVAPTSFVADRAGSVGALSGRTISFVRDGSMCGVYRAPPSPTSAARSHVGNGAVKGAITSTMSQQAMRRETMYRCLVQGGVASAAPRVRCTNATDCLEMECFARRASERDRHYCRDAGGSST